MKKLCKGLIEGIGVYLIFLCLGLAAMCGMIAGAGLGTGLGECIGTQPPGAAQAIPQELISTRMILFIMTFPFAIPFLVFCLPTRMVKSLYEGIGMRTSFFFMFTMALILVGLTTQWYSVIPNWIH